MGGFPILETFFGTHACPCNNSGGSTNGGKGSSSSALQTPHPTHPSPLLFLHATAAVAAPHTLHNPVARQMDFCGAAAAPACQPHPASPDLRVQAIGTCARSTTCTPPLSPWTNCR